MTPPGRFESLLEQLAEAEPFEIQDSLTIEEEEKDNGALTLEFYFSGYNTGYVTYHIDETARTITTTEFHPLQQADQLRGRGIAALTMAMSLIYLLENDHVTDIYTVYHDDEVSSLLGGFYDRIGLQEGVSLQDYLVPLIEYLDEKGFDLDQN